MQLANVVSKKEEETLSLPLLKGLIDLIYFVLHRSHLNKKHILRRYHV